MDITMDRNHEPNSREHSVDHNFDVCNSSDNEDIHTNIGLNPISPAREPAHREPDGNGSSSHHGARDDMDDNDIAAAAIAHAQAMLDAHNNLPNQSDNDDLEPMPKTHLNNLRIGQEYINLIKSATLDNGKLDAETVKRLRSPTPRPVNIDNPDDRLSIELFTAMDAREATYTRCRDAVRRRYPDSNLLTFYNVKKLVAQASGVVPVMDDMCINSCHAFTGPFEDLDKCYVCSALRYDPYQASEHGRNVPRQQACTI
ncbi:hypothetical protein C0991_010713 [Blastosporella zonata]|nr:hypothetical protein C0991_010713 [Blastosporella zonata]